jgi:hypothetical protein
VLDTATGSPGAGFTDVRVDRVPDKTVRDAAVKPA